MVTLIAVAIILFPGETLAQLVKVPLHKGIPATNSKTKSSSTARTKSLTLSLPFFDDFSATETLNPFNPFAGFPDQNLWDKSFDVWINEGVGIDPPSINVASLNGLDSAGRVYSNQDENGFSDVLTSHAIDLSVVPEGERNSVFLSFYFQWQGNGEAPDSKEDYFTVEFLNQNETDSIWVTAMKVIPKLTYDREAFYDTIVQVQGAQFFTDKFRFRFRNYGNLSGPYDTWNLDYIYLNKNRNLADLTFLDRAIGSQLSPIFGEYRSVPVKHFRENPIYTVPEVDVQNLRGGPAGAPTDYNMIQEFRNYTDGVLTLVTKPFGPIPSKYPDNNLQPGERFRSVLKTDKAPIDLNDPAFVFSSHFLPDADSIELKVKIDIYEPDAGVFSSNDTISETYRLDNYYAYDDGTAEYAAVLSQADDQIAVGFNLLGDAPQELVGFDIYIPSYSVSGFTTVDFFVMNAENGEPKEKIFFVNHVVRTKGRDGFQSVRFDPVVVQGQFFIGWRGSSTDPLRVGLDFSTNTANKIFEDLNCVVENERIKWFPSQGLTEGSLMLRPNFGDKGIFTGVEPEKLNIKFYPNPARNGKFFIEGEFDALEITSVSGKAVSFDLLSDSERSQIALTHPVAGLYIVRIRKGEVVQTSKLVVH